MNKREQRALVRRAFFFDVDDTLYDHLAPMREALTEVLNLPETFPFDRAYYLFRYYSDLLSDREGLSAVPDKQKVKNMQRSRFIHALADLGVTVSVGQAEQLQAAYYARQFAIRPFKGAFELIRKLSGRGMFVGLITNGAGQHQMSKIEVLKVQELISPERMFISGTLGIAKPDPGLFALVNRETGLQAEECIYIGDSWRNDVVGSLEAGWTSVWFNHRGAEPESEHKPHHIAASYEEMEALLLKELQPNAPSPGIFPADSKLTAEVEVPE